MRSVAVPKKPLSALLLVPLLAPSPGGGGPAGEAGRFGDAPIQVDATLRLEVVGQGADDEADRVRRIQTPATPSMVKNRESADDLSHNRQDVTTQIWLRHRA